MLSHPELYIGFCVQLTEEQDFFSPFPTVCIQDDLAVTHTYTRIMHELPSSSHTHANSDSLTHSISLSHARRFNNFVHNFVHNFGHQHPKIKIQSRM